MYTAKIILPSGTLSFLDKDWSGVPEVSTRYITLRMDLLLGMLSLCGFRILDYRIMPKSVSRHGTSVSLAVCPSSWGFFSLPTGDT